MKFVFQTMLFGEDANNMVEGELGGVSCHRRTLQVYRFFLDCHVRIREAFIGTSAFEGPGYMASLGHELGAMDSKTFENFIRCVLMWVRKEYPTRPVDGAPFLCSFPNDHELYQVLVQTEFYRLIRFMLSKSLHLGYRFY